MKLPLPPPPLRLPALLLAGSLALGIGLLVWGLDRHAESRAHLARVRIGETGAARAAAEAPGKVQRCRETRALFAKLQREGFLGQEQRAAWITALGQAQASLKLHSLSWHLAPQAPSPLAPGLRVSGMNISASPVDATSLEILLDQLHRTAPTPFTVQRCTLLLNPDGRSGQADCHLNWWTWEDAR